MGNRRKHYIANPQLNEFLNHIFCGLTAEDKRFLTLQEMRKIQPGANLRRFVQEASLEEQLIMASKVGFRSYIVVNPTKWNAKGLKNLYTQFQKNGNRSAMIDTMVQEKIFVLGSDQMLLAASYLNRNCHTDHWTLNRNFQKLYRLWELAGEKLGIRIVDEEIKEISKGAKFLAELAFWNNKMFHSFIELGLEHSYDLTILLCLVRKTKKVDYVTTFVLDKDIFIECNDGSWKYKRFAMRMTWLTNNGYVEKGIGKTYSISDRGLLVTTTYLKRLAEISTTYI